MLKRLIKSKIFNNKWINPIWYTFGLDARLNDLSQDYITFLPDSNLSLQEIAGYSNRPEINQTLALIHQRLQSCVLEAIAQQDSTTYEILDIGCGPGLFLKDFETKGNLTGIDISLGMTKIAKVQLPNAEIHTGHFLKYTFSKTFDTIYSIGVLIYFSKTQVKFFFEKIHSLLNDNGLVFISYPHAYREIDLKYPDFTYVHYSPQFLEALVQKKFDILYHAHVNGGRKVEGFDDMAIAHPHGYEGRTYQNSSILILKKK